MGAGRLTREFFDEQPPKPKQVKRLRKYVREQIAPVAENLLRYGTPDMTVGTSKRSVRWRVFVVRRRIRRARM